MQHPNDLQAQIDFLCGQYMFTIILAWAISASGTIIDLECMNALARDFRCEGRPPNFSTTSAKLTIHQFEQAFKSRYGRDPQDHLKEAMGAMRTLLQKAQDSKQGVASANLGGIEAGRWRAGRKGMPGPQRGHKTGFTDFSSYTHSRAKQLDHSLVGSVQASLVHSKSFKSRVGQMWKALSWAERESWEAKAQKLNDERSAAETAATESHEHVLSEGLATRPANLALQCTCE